jgi:hypothetical protein
MSEDRLEKALQEMRDEPVDAGTLDAARVRVRDRLISTAVAGCAEFRQDFSAYLGGTLTGSRRLLMEDHLSRCPACRAAMAERKGESRVIPMPQRSTSRPMRWGALATAAAMVLSVLYLGRGTIDSWMAPDGPRATVVSADGDLYRLPGGTLEAGAAIGEGEVIRTGPGSHAVLRLADGSMVDVNERTELFVSAAWSGRAIHLQRGDVIVRAAEQRNGRLRVLTRDSIASVKGTVFAVSTGMGGSVVSVVEGSVAVDQPGSAVLLSPGQQAASNPALASSVAQAVSWSPDADEYLQLLASFVEIERQLAEMAPGQLRTSSTLLPHLPANAFVYGAVPNLGGKIGQALILAEQQAAENTVFGAWWNSETGMELRQIVDRMQSVTSLLGDEIAFSISSAGAPGTEVPMVIARVQPGREAELAGRLQQLFTVTDDPAPAYSIAGDLVVISTSSAHLTWALGHLGQGAGSPFAAAINDRYQRGAGWLIGVDASPVIAMAAGDDAPPVELAAMTGVKYLFLEQRAPAGAEENEVTVVFDGIRKGMASWLADAGSGGAAEYVAADALLAGYVSTREPRQLFEEFTAFMMKENSSFGASLAELNERLGAGYLETLTGALGTEAAFAVNGLSLSGPVWTMAAVAYDPAAIDSSLQTLVNAINADLAADQQPIAFRQENAGGRVWSSITAGALPFGITWTYDRGYMVAASDRTSAERAIATRSGGSQLVWSPEFLGQVPASAGMHPAAFVWLNAKGALDLISSLAPSPALTELVARRDPVLVVFDGSAEQIHAASRARITGLIMDAMLLESLTRTREGTESDTVR